MDTVYSGLLYPLERGTGESLGSKEPIAPFFLQKSVVHLAFKISGAIAQEVKEVRAWLKKKINILNG